MYRRNLENQSNRFVVVLKFLYSETSIAKLCD